MAMLTKSQQVQLYIRQAIAAKRWSPGDKLPGERELVQELGVSNTTLRHALYALVCEGLIVRKHGSGTYIADSNEAPCIAILARATQLSSRMGFWYHNLVEEAQALISAYGYRPVLAIGHGDTPEEFAASISLFDANNSNKILGVLSLTNPGALSERFEALGIHLVAIRSATPGPGKYSVVLDYVQMTDDASEMLRKHGYNDFAIMYTDYSDSPMAGLNKAMNDRMLDLARTAVDYSEDRIILVKSSLEFDQAYNKFKEWWAKPNHPNAIFFYEDAVCDVATRAILELGIKVPNELAIITHANINRQFQFPVPLTRVGFDSSKVTLASCDMLNQLIKHGTVEVSTVYISPSFIDGESL